MPVDAFFGSSYLYDRVDVEHLLFLDVAVDSCRPRALLEIFCEVGGAVFIGGEFVEIVVGRDVLIWRFFFRGAEGTLLEAVNFGVGAGGEWRSGEITHTPRGRG